MTYSSKLAKTLMTFLLLATFSGGARADDISKGMRGPTNFQIDERIVYSRSSAGSTALTNNLILKYWDGDHKGKWAFVSFPYRSVNTANGSRTGLGDVSVGLGPRGRLETSRGDFHWFSYGALTFPTGDPEGPAPLGSGRHEKKLGGSFTYLFPGEIFEIDGAAEYRFTGKNKDSIDPPNELYAGLVAGRKLTDKTRLAAGITYLEKENDDYLLNSRVVFRYTHSPSLHFELVGDAGLFSDNIPEGFSLGVYSRFNF